MSTPIGCLFTSTSLYVWSATQLLGWVLPLFLTLFARYRDPVTKQWVAEAFLVLFSFYLYLCLALLYIFQIALHQLHPDPFCPENYTYGYPALCPFYIGIAVGLTLFLPMFLHFNYGIVQGLTVLACIWIAPAAVLIWFSIHTPAQVGLSLGVGVLMTLLYMLVFRFCLLRFMPYLINLAPFSMLSLTETWFSTDQQQLNARRIRQWLDDMNKRKYCRCC